MNTDLSQALLVVSLVSLSCAVLSPVLCWILPNRRTHRA